MRGSFTEDMFRHSPFDILHDDMLEGFVGEGCSRMKYVVGNLLGECPGHNDVSLTRFVM